MEKDINLKLEKIVASAKRDPFVEAYLSILKRERDLANARKVREETVES